MPDKNDFSEIIADLLRSQDRTNTILERMDKRMEDMGSKQDTIIASFDRFATAVVDRLNNIDTQLTKLADVEDRLKRLEAEVFKR